MQGLASKAPARDAVSVRTANAEAFALNSGYLLGGAVLALQRKDADRPHCKSLSAFLDGWR